MTQTEELRSLAEKEKMLFFACEMWVAAQAIKKNKNTARNKKLIYILKNSKTKLIKIGVTHNLKSRLSALESSVGIKLEVLFTSEKLDNAYEIEQKLHKEFSNERKLGEWFSIDAGKAIKETERLLSNYFPEDITPDTDHDLSELDQQLSFISSFMNPLEIVEIIMERCWINKEYDKYFRIADAINRRSQELESKQNILSS